MMSDKPHKHRFAGDHHCFQCGRSAEDIVEELETAIDAFLNTQTAGDDGELLITAVEQLALATGHFERRPTAA
jgi:hypothetical protein